MLNLNSLLQKVPVESNQIKFQSYIILFVTGEVTEFQRGDVICLKDSRFLKPQISGPRLGLPMLRKQGLSISINLWVCREDKGGYQGFIAGNRMSTTLFLLYVSCCYFQLYCGWGILGNRLNVGVKFVFQTQRNSSFVSASEEQCF